jgi:hypothetical protein
MFWRFLQSEQARLLLPGAPKRAKRHSKRLPLLREPYAGPGISVPLSQHSPAASTEFRPSVRPTFLTRLSPKVRLRQVRVQHKDCSRFWNQFDAASNKCEPVLHESKLIWFFLMLHFLAIIMTFHSDSARSTIRFCYPDYADGQEETTYIKNWNSVNEIDSSGLNDGIKDAFKWKSIADSKELFIFPGVIGNYPGSGFLLDFAASASERQAQLMNLQESFWIDIKTRAVFLDMAFYNPNTDMFITIRILFEFHSCGSVSMMPTYRIMRLDKYPLNSFWNFVEIGAQGGVALMVSDGMIS